MKNANIQSAECLSTKASIENALRNYKIDQTDENFRELSSLLQQANEEGLTVLLRADKINRKLFPYWAVRTVLPPLENDCAGLLRFSEKPRDSVKHYLAEWVGNITEISVFKVDNLVEVLGFEIDSEELVKAVNGELNAFKQAKKKFDEYEKKTQETSNSETERQLWSDYIDGARKMSEYLRLIKLAGCSPVLFCANGDIEVIGTIGATVNTQCIQYATEIGAEYCFEGRSFSGIDRIEILEEEFADTKYAKR